jgi:hypothetical protein
MTSPDTLGRYSRVEDNLYAQALAMGDAARDSLRKNDLPGAVARYEAACTRLLAARELAQANVHMAGQLADQAYREAAEAAKDYRWPIDRLTREEYTPSPWPKWAVATTDGGNGDARVSLGQSARQDDPTPMLLTVEAEDVDGKGNSTTAQVTLPQLRALLALAERIDAGLAIPYDTAGNFQVP